MCVCVVSGVASPTHMTTVVRRGMCMTCTVLASSGRAEIRKERNMFTCRLVAGEQTTRTCNAMHQYIIHN